MLLRHNVLEYFLRRQRLSLVSAIEPQPRTFVVVVVSNRKIVPSFLVLVLNLILIPIKNHKFIYLFQIVLTNILNPKIAFGISRKKLFFTIRQRLVLFTRSRL